MILIVLLEVKHKPVKPFAVTIWGAIVEEELVNEYVEFEDTYTPSIEITITDTHLIITCDNPEVSKKFVSSFVMDGMILHFQEQKNNVTFYKIVGNTENMSVN